MKTISDMDLSKAQTEIGAAWQTLQGSEESFLRSQKEKHTAGVAFGRVCREWKKKFGAQGKDGEGLIQVLNKLKISHSKAIYWMNLSAGKTGHSSNHNHSDRLPRVKSAVTRKHELVQAAKDAKMYAKHIAKDLAETKAAKSGLKSETKRSKDAKKSAKKSAKVKSAPKSLEQAALTFWDRLLPIRDMLRTFRPYFGEIRRTSVWGRLQPTLSECVNLAVELQGKKAQARANTPVPVLEDVEFKN